MNVTLKCEIPKDPFTHTINVIVLYHLKMLSHGSLYTKLQKIKGAPHKHSDLDGKCERHLRTRHSFTITWFPLFRTDKIQ